MFADRITGVVFNPPWTVPAKIAADENGVGPGHAADQADIASIAACATIRTASDTKADPLILQPVAAQ